MRSAKYNLIVLIMLIQFSFISTVFAQLKLEEKDVPSRLGTVFTMLKVKNPTINLGSIGENQYWDYSQFQADEIQTWEVVEPAAAPLINRFPAANLIYKVTSSASDTISYNFAEINSEILTELGQIEILGETITDSIVLIDPDPRFAFPVNYGDKWITMRSLKAIVFSTEVPVVDSSSYEVDAWGIMKCAMGEISCLRVIQYNVTTVVLELASIPIQNVINYYWITNEYGILANVYSKNEEDDPNYTQASHAYFMSDFVASVDESDISASGLSKYHLLVNYPNPFNPATRIEYRVPCRTNVKLSIFNTAGQEVAQLLNSEQLPGYHAINWDGGLLPSGNYFIRLSADGSYLTKKCLLLK